MTGISYIPCKVSDIAKVNQLVLSLCSDELTSTHLSCIPRPRDSVHCKSRHTLISLLNSPTPGSVIAAVDELVRKFRNGYEGPFECKGQRAQDSVSIGEVVSKDVHGTCTPTMVDGGMAVDQQDEMASNADTSTHGQIGGFTSTKMDNAADAIGMVVSNPGNTESEVRFGESAISPIGGSEVGIHSC
jgi:hypothetical protein